MKETGGAPAGPLEIRPYREEDRAGVIALWREVFPDDPPRNDPERVIERKCRVQRDLFLVGLAGEEIVATVLAGYDGFRGWIYHLAVRPTHRRRGLGRRMMAGAEERLRAIGCPKVNLQVRAANRGVIEFYRRLGYGTEERASMGKVLEGE